MSEACTHDCSSCKSNCDHRAPQHEPPHARSRIQKVIGVVSGKGGVGKSMTSAMLAVSMRRLGFKAGVLDADITGPSIPRLFGVKGPATGDGESINPVSSRTGVEIMSINLLLDDLRQEVTCTACGAKTKSDNAFCPKCGAKLPEKPAPAEEEPVAAEDVTAGQTTSEEEKKDEK